MIEEIIYISAFDVNPNGTIGIRQTTDVVKDGVVIASSYWRTVLAVNDPRANTILGVDTFYGNIATYTWSIAPEPTPTPDPTEPTE